MDKANEIITVDQMADYINIVEDDVLRDEALEILTDIANGAYSIDSFRLDLIDYVKENYKANGMPKTYEEKLF
mgnify:CR=1 FL=1